MFFIVCHTAKPFWNGSSSLEKFTSLCICYVSIDPQEWWKNTCYWCKAYLYEFFYYRNLWWHWHMTSLSMSRHNYDVGPPPRPPIPPSNLHYKGSNSVEAIDGSLPCSFPWVNCVIGQSGLSASLKWINVCKQFFVCANLSFQNCWLVLRLPFREGHCLTFPCWWVPFPPPLCHSPPPHHQPSTGARFFYLFIFWLSKFYYHWRYYHFMPCYFWLHCSLLQTQFLHLVPSHFLQGIQGSLLKGTGTASYHLGLDKTGLEKNLGIFSCQHVCV